MKPIIDICADLGEGFGKYSITDDDRILEIVSSANIACGFHAGDPRTIQKAVQSAKKFGTGIGAHPGFPDLVGFGRRNMDLTYEEVYTDVLYQVGAISAFTKANDVNLQHILPHGQLGNMANDSPIYAAAIAEAIKDFDSSLIVMTQPGCLLEACKERGLTTAITIFADRAYHVDGSLVSRKEPNSVITDPETILTRTLKMVLEKKVTAITGEEMDIHGHTLLVHGDTEGSLQLIHQIKSTLLENGVEILPLGEWIEKE
ncbi:LamB/YcsF family protein [Bacillus sp. B1-b2]|uniref:LamB/YcsF family protein n=1 Tax=Bacillus sp. B1-b2 TaxID=2653201 RepID=UPI0012624090|nr:5-oxoprolinase subunit PxpA [Bacillus sp. B1-b2]KAB7667751.1 LamB/YcsF family protein [Bacillus sp. B1-b2]